MSANPVKYLETGVNCKPTDSCHLLQAPGWSDTLNASQTCFSKM